MSGRGRGRAAQRSPSPVGEAVVHLPNQPSQPVASTSSFTPNRISSAGGSSVASLLRKNDYVKKDTGAPSVGLRFQPKMVKRKIKEEEPIAVDHASPPIPRGRGRGRPAYEQTASGAFAQGPMTASKKDKLISTSGGSKTSRSGAGSSSNKDRDVIKKDEEPDPLGISSDEDDLHDDDATLATRKIATTSLADIGKEGPMAPLTLPRDQGNVLGEFQELMMASIAPLPSVVRKIKDEPTDPDVEMSVAMSRDPSSSGSSIKIIEGDEKRTQPKVIRAERVADSFLADSAQEKLFVMQFPRVFPQFKSNIRQHIDLSAMDIDGEDEKKDVKPDLKGAKLSDYAPGKWQGWGRDSGRAGRDLSDLSFEGQIGHLEVRQNGQVDVVLGHGQYKMRYSVLPASPTSFLQEVGMHISESLDDSMGAIDPGLYIMGQVANKFILRPDIQQLLTELDRQRRDHEEIEAADKVKKEEPDDIMDKSLSDLLKPASAPVKSTSSSKSSGKPRAKKRAA